MASNSRTRATPNRIAIAEREAKALELRKSGKTFDEIARALGYSERGGAAKAVGRALDATVRERADELRTLETERLDALTAALWPRAMEGDLRAVDRVLSIMNRRAKLLGLDAPSRRAIEVITAEAFERMVDGVEAELRDLDLLVAQAAGVGSEDHGFDPAQRV